MEVFLIRLLQFMLAISLLVLLHEGGHFFFAKLFGVRVDKFYLFFDPWFHLFEFKPKNSDTAYGIGWLPLGGYCKIAGMIDESFDTEQMKQPEQPWEFRSKPAWQRLLIMIGGVLVNFLLALFIYSMVLFHWGDEYMSVKDMSMGFKFNTEAKQIGFQDHDILYAYDGKAFDRYDVDVFRHLADAKTVTVKRNGADVTINMPEEMSLITMLQADPAFARPFIPAEVDSVFADTPASKIGLKKGDKILAINNKPVDSWNEFVYQVGVLSDVLSTAKTSADSLKTRTVQLVYSSGDEAIDTAKVVLTPELMLGVTQTTLANYYQTGCAARLCKRFEICGNGRRSKIVGWLWRHRQSVPTGMGLDDVLAYDSLPVYHPGFHEYPAYSRSRWWTCALPDLRDGNRTQAQRELHD